MRHLREIKHPRVTIFSYTFRFSTERTYHSYVRDTHTFPNDRIPRVIQVIHTHHWNIAKKPLGAELKFEFKFFLQALFRVSPRKSEETTMKISKPRLVPRYILWRLPRVPTRTRAVQQFQEFRDSSLLLWGLFPRSDLRGFSASQILERHFPKNLCTTSTWLNHTLRALGKELQFHSERLEPAIC